MEQLLADEGQTQQPVAVFGEGAALPSLRCCCCLEAPARSKVKGVANTNTASLMIEQAALALAA